MQLVRKVIEPRHFILTIILTELHNLLRFKGGRRTSGH